MVEKMDAPKKLFVITTAFAVLSLSSQLVVASVKSNAVRVNRYTLEDALPSDAQINLLSAIVDIEFSSEIQTVGQALQALLAIHGFKLGEIYAGNFSQYVLFNLPLPKVHRQLGPLPLERALRVLGGEGFSLQVNPVTREVSYQILDAYDALVSTGEVLKAKSRWEALSKQTELGDTTNCDQSIAQRDVHAVQGDASISMATSAGLQAGKLYGPTHSGDYLSRIAINIKPQGATLEQTLIALFTLNSNAFSENNINLLKVGVVLKIPSSNAIENIDPIQAKQQVREHHQAWLAYLRDVSETPGSLSD